MAGHYIIQIFKSQNVVIISVFKQLLQGQLISIKKKYRF